jgi:surface protein
MPTKSTYYIDAPNFADATAIYTDSGMTTCAPNGFYSMQGITRELVGCVLLPPTVCPACEFISIWDTTNTSSGSSNANQVKLPLVSGGTYNFSVDWGDGTKDLITSWNQAEVTHTYLSSGTYTITIKGTIIGWAFAGTGDRLKILEILQWGCFNHGDEINVFASCSNLELTNVSDTLELHNNVTLRQFFVNCTSLTTINNLNNWNVSNINNFFSMFFGCINFNDNLNDWDVTGANTYNGLNVAEGLHGMFKGCSLFNQPLNNWDVSNAQTLNAIFENCTSFNQDISMWDTSQVKDFQATFANCTAFDQQLGTWDMGNALTLSQFMQGKTQFNYSAANFDTTLVGWAAQTLQNGVVADFGLIKYTPIGQAAATSIVTNYAWTINSGGLI